MEIFVFFFNYLWLKCSVFLMKKYFYKILRFSTVTDLFSEIPLERIEGCARMQNLQFTLILNVKLLAVFQKFSFKGNLAFF